ncbi:hypothetical protein [Actinomadura kijaniata]|uniref:hypothetical protein n=1 Tax=Actinomadura kijaniata TaxID=46161 RepID=UPI00082AF3A1|nr:hypothetical protein [Actinomadura kijaniata]
MTTATMNRPAVFAVADIGTEQVVADIKRHFPGVLAWFGEFTGKWWAVVDDRMIEADTPGQLHQQISDASPKTIVGVLVEETGAVGSAAPPPWPLPAPRPPAPLRVNAARREPAPRCVDVLPRHVDVSPRRTESAYPPPFPEPGRWRRFTDRRRRLLGISTGEDW